jgi:hypothetical protein
MQVLMRPRAAEVGRDHRPCFSYEIAIVLGAVANNAMTAHSSGLALQAIGVRIRCSSRTSGHRGQHAPGHGGPARPQHGHLRRRRLAAPQPLRRPPEASQKARITWP